MFYNVLKLKELGKTDKQFEKEILMEHDNSSLSVISLKKEEIIDTHTSTCDVAVVVIDGEIELHFDAEKFKIEKGEILMFKKDKQHKVVALKDSRFLLIKIQFHSNLFVQSEEDLAQLQLSDNQSEE